LESKGEQEEALKIYNQGAEVNPMWDYLTENQIRAMAYLNNRDEAIRLQLDLVEKATHDYFLLRSRYSDLSRLYWSFNEKEEAIKAAENATDTGLIKFYTEGDNSILLKQVENIYSGLKERSEYVSQLWMGLDYAYAGEREIALECFNNAIALKEPAITFLLLRDYQFFNIKYLSFALIIRKIKQLINH
jgi:tetratricopeptide (TPR) repeat protein